MSKKDVTKAPVGRPRKPKEEDYSELKPYAFLPGVRPQGAKNRPKTSLSGYHIERHILRELCIYHPEFKELCLKHNLDPSKTNIFSLILWVHVRELLDDKVVRARTLARFGVAEIDSSAGRAEEEGVFLYSDDQLQAMLREDGKALNRENVTVQGQRLVSERNSKRKA